MSSPRAAVRALRAGVLAHPRHVVLVAFVAGLVLGGWVPGLALAVAGGLAAVVLRLAGRAALAVLAATATLTGAALADARRAAIDRGALPARVGAQLRAEVTLLEPAHRRASGEWVARARVANGEAVLLKALGGLEGKPVGRIVAIRGRMAALRPFDELQRRRGALAAIAVAAARDTGRGRAGPAGVLDAVRERAKAGMAAGLAAPEAALAHGMVLGDDTAVAEEVRDDFRRSGLAHLLAASGTNVMLLATLVLGIGALAGVPLRPRLAGALVLVAAYVPLAGGGPSIQRAGVMGAAGLVAALAGRPASRWYAIGLAAAVSLALNPYAAADPGWQLSFAAVLGLMLLGRPLGRGLATDRVPRALTEAAAMTVAATLATAPLLALHFESVSIASLPANVLAAPAVAPLMWLGTLAGALGQLAPGAAAPLNALNAYLLGFVAGIADVCAALPAASLPIRLPGPLAVVAAYAALALAALAAKRLNPRAWAGFSTYVRGKSGPSVAAVAVAVATTGAVALALVLALGGDRGVAPPPARGETVVSFLDVGQGDATLIQRDGASILVDTGPPGGPILERLKEAGVRRLDALFITHAQLDHEGAVLSVIHRHRPRLIINGGYGWPTSTQQALRAGTRSAEMRLHVPEAGQVLHIGKLTLRILWPPRALMRAPPHGDPNHRAVVAHLESGDFDLLLPADAESEVQAILDLPRVEALKVAHHGSADTNLPTTLRRLQPKIAAIEVGHGNTYGHPTPSTLATLTAAVDDVYRTDRDGTIRLHVRDGAMRVQTSGGSGRR